MYLSPSKAIKLETVILLGLDADKPSATSPPVISSYSTTAAVADDEEEEVVVVDSAGVEAFLL